MVYETRNARETFQLGEQFGAQAKAGQIYALEGDLGVGKTAFSQGFARGMAVQEPVNSPTFTILQEYRGEHFPLYHFDVYRIEDAAEMEDIGFTEYIFGEGVSLIEWADKIAEILPEDCIHICMEKDLHKDPDYRRITVRGADAL